MPENVVLTQVKASEKSQRQMVKGVITFKAEFIFKCAFWEYNPLAEQYLPTIMPDLSSMNWAPQKKV